MTDGGEEWRGIPGYEGIYSVSNLGRVLSHERRCTTYNGTRLVRTRILKANYRDYRKHGGGEVMTVNLHKEGEKTIGFSVMRLVLMAFDRLPHDGEIAHVRDGNVRNVRRENLEWSTASEISVANGSLPPWRKAIQPTTAEPAPNASTCEAGGACKPGPQG